MGTAKRAGSRSASHWFFQFLGSGLGTPLQVLTLGLVGVGVFVGVTLPELPDVQTLRNAQLQEPLRVYSADGRLIGEFGIERRRPVSIRQIPPLVIEAFLATEDSRFFEHRGIDTQGLGRALLSYLTTGEKAQGGSTISMQLTRNFFLSPEKTFQRKLAEVLLTLHVEQTLTKEEILELYLNQIFFGHRAYGISAAASFYYDKPLDRLTIAEAAMLAGIPKAPSTNNPITNPGRALERRDYILGRMLELGYIDAGQHTAAIATPDTAQAHRRGPEIEAGYVAEMARAEIVRFYGEDAINRGYRVTTTLEPRLQLAAQESVRTALRQYDRRHGYRGPETTLDIAGLSETELDARLDEVTRVPELAPGFVTRVSASGAEVYIGRGERVELSRQGLSWARTQRNLGRWRGERRRGPNAVAVGDLVRLRRTPKDGWVLTPIPAVSGALVALDPHDGAVRALVGGYAFSDSKFNRAVDMRRQPGSSFKPFVYAAALDKGWTPASLLRDEAVRLTGNQRWNPRNADGRELGPINMRRSLALSRNLASINLLQSVGLEDAQNYIRRFGFDTQALPLGLSMVLGTGELSPVKLAEGYAVFANGGYHVTPYFIQRIEDGDGQVVFEARPARACPDCWYKTGNKSAATRGLVAQGQGLAERVIDPRTAYQMTSLLREVIERGTGTRAKRLDRPDVVGKTGTTNDIRDSWFAGYQAEFVTVAWMGFDDFGKLGRGEEGGRAAIGIWVDFMEQALKGRPVATLGPPTGLVEVRVDPARGVETQGQGGVVELVQEEYRDALLGPEPVRVAGPSARKSGGSGQSSAPRVMDDLF
ncbi:MAG: penicillin-binding protein 1A [Chromatiales bacterium]|nr:penicillin-binding protein 1A [Chromatiales bacterium]